MFILTYLIYCCVLLTFAKPTVSDKDRNAVIESYSSTEGNRGNYYSYKTSNNIGQEQVFLIKDENLKDKFEIRGNYYYTDTDGKPVNVNYIADENGFRILKPVITRFNSATLASLAGGGIGK